MATEISSPPLACPRSVPCGSLLGVLLAFAACGPAPAPGAPPSAAASGERSTFVTMNFDDTEVDTILRAVGMTLEKRVVVDPEVRALVNCTVVTVHAGRAPRADAVRAVTAALREKGIVIAETADAVEVKRAPDAAPCARGR